jgi:DNA-binding response OmpR family regulator/AraC-like DNA-binding protein
VLVVEDDPGVREGLGLILDDHYDVLFADDGPPALEQVRRRHVDAVLLDLGLPSMSGFDVLAGMRKATPGLPVVVVTITTTTEAVVRAMKLGASDYLTKPFRDEDVLAKIGDAVAGPKRAGPDGPGLQPRSVATHRRRRCLVVVGDLGTAGTLKLVLEPRVATEVVRDGVAALRTLGGAIPDCVVCDGEGWAAEGAALVRALRARYADCRVAFLTRDDEADRASRSSLVDAQVPLRSTVGALTRLIVALCSAEEEAAHEHNEHVQGAIDYLRVGYAEDVTMEAVARAAGLSRSRLAELFRAEVGLSLGEYVTALRVEVAKLLLSRESLRLEDVASRAGFCNASHFSRVFRDRTGRRPGAYRRGEGGHQTLPD